MDFYILKTLPFKIEVKNVGNEMTPNERISVGFVHDILKFNFLTETIKNEFDKSNGNSLILSGILFYFYKIYFQVGQ